MREFTSWEIREKQKRGKRTVTCQVSGRYLKYEKTDPNEIGFGFPVVMYVMTDGFEKRDKKLCELVFSLEDLEVMVAQLKADITKVN